MIAVYRRGARFHIGQRGIVGGQPRGRRRYGDNQQRRERGSTEKFTCSGNWGLRRLPG
jgi:hypothetical protein